MCDRWRGGSPGYKWAFCAQLYGSDRRLRCTSRTFGWHSPQFSCDIAWPSTFYRATAANMAPSLAGGRTVRVRPAFQSSLSVTLHVPRRHGAIVDNTPASWWRRPEWRNAATSARQLRAPTVKCMSPFVVCLFPLGHTIPAGRCVPWTQLTTLLRNVLPCWQRRLSGMLNYVEIVHQYFTRTLSQSSTWLP
jgi:hypothetical protein